MVKRFLLLLISIFIINSLYCQKSSEFNELKKFSNIGITFGGLYYRTPTIEDQYGYYSIHPVPALSYCFGITYNLPIYNNWSFESGLLFVNEASLSAKGYIERADLPVNWGDNFDFTINEPIGFTASIPLLVNYNLNIFKNNYLNFQLGMKTLIMFSSSNRFSIFFVNDDTNEDFPVFSLHAASPDIFFYGSFVYGIGYSIDCNHILLKFKLNHSINFQNTFEGNYQFLNLKQNEDSGGSYKLSGDYLSLTLTAHLKKIKYWKKKK